MLLADRWAATEGTGPPRGPDQHHRPGVGRPTEGCCADRRGRRQRFARVPRPWYARACSVAPYLPLLAFAGGPDRAGGGVAFGVSGQDRHRFGGGATWDRVITTASWVAGAEGRDRIATKVLGPAVGRGPVERGRGRFFRCVPAVLFGGPPWPWPVFRAVARARCSVTPEDRGRHSRDRGAPVRALRFLCRACLPPRRSWRCCWWFQLPRAHRVDVGGRSRWRVAAVRLGGGAACGGRVGRGRRFALLGVGRRRAGRHVVRGALYPRRFCPPPVDTANSLTVAPAPRPRTTTLVVMDLGWPGFSARPPCWLPIVDRTGCSAGGSAPRHIPAGH